MALEHVAKNYRAHNQSVPVLRDVTVAVAEGVYVRVGGAVAVAACVAVTACVTVAVAVSVAVTGSVAVAVGSGWRIMTSSPGWMAVPGSNGLSALISSILSP